MKVVLNTFGIMQSPEFLKKIRGKSEWEWRTDEKVVALIEKRQEEIKFLQELKSQNKVTETQEARLSKLLDRDENWLFFRIQEVDISRKWCIADYDSSKHIQYLDVENEELNFYGFI